MERLGQPTTLMGVAEEPDEEPAVSPVQPDLLTLKYENWECEEECSESSSPMMIQCLSLNWISAAKIKHDVTTRT